MAPNLIKTYFDVKPTMHMRLQQKPTSYIVAMNALWLCQLAYAYIHVMSKSMIDTCFGENAWSCIYTGIELILSKESQLIQEARISSRFCYSRQRKFVQRFYCCLLLALFFNSILYKQFN